MSKSIKACDKQTKANHAAMRKARKTGSQLNASLSRKQWAIIRGDKS